MGEAVRGMENRGDLADFGAFYERTYPGAFRVAYGVVGESGLADDVTQDAYVAAYRKRDRFRGDGPVDAWLYRIVVNTAISTLRHRRVRPIVPVDPLVLERPSGLDQTAAALDRMAIEDALRALDARARSAVVLRYYLDFDYSTIASILGTSADNVGVILSRSLDRMRAAMDPSASPTATTLEREVGHGG